jgi:hypothetical protein
MAFFIIIGAGGGMVSGEGQRSAIIGKIILGARRAGKCGRLLVSTFEAIRRLDKPFFPVSTVTSPIAMNAIKKDRQITTGKNYLAENQQDIRVFAGSDG